MAERVVTVPLRRRALTRRTVALVLLALALVLAAVALAALLIGTEVIAADRLLAILMGDGDATARAIVVDLRLPRVALAAGVGAALASCGVLFQALLRNPLAEPYILGVSNGGAVGAIIGYLLGAGPLAVSALSFAGAAAVIAIVLLVSRRTFGVRSESMLLSGVMIDAVTAAIIFMLLHFMGQEVRTAVQWLMGDLTSAPEWVGGASVALLVVLLGVSLFAGGALNALSLGDEEAASLGLNVQRARIVSYLGASLVVGVAVSFCGAIGFVGLVVPHILRRSFSADHRLLLPASVLGGAIFLVLSDTLARTIMPMLGSGSGELPVGAVTALVGAPLFIALLRRRAGLGEEG